MATEPENFRGIHAIKVLTGRSGYTLDKLIETAYDPYLPAFEKLIPGLIEAFDKSAKKYESLRPAIDTLRHWDRTVSKESVAMSLAHFYLTIYMQKGERDADMESIDIVNFFGTGSPYQERLEMFSLAVQKLTEDFGTWNTPGERSIAFNDWVEKSSNSLMIQNPASLLGWLLEIGEHWPRLVLGVRPLLNEFMELTETVLWP
jgi:hypothetical protein